MTTAPKSRLRASASAFAGLAPAFIDTSAKGGKAETDEERDLEEEEDDSSGQRAEGDDEGATGAAAEDNPDDDGKPAKGAKSGKGKAEGDDDEECDAEDPDDDGPDAEDDDDPASAYRAGLAEGRRRENLRCSRIFSSTEAKGKPVLAAVLAFTTRNSSAAARRILDASVAGEPIAKPRGNLARAMGERTEPRPGGGAGGEPTFADAMAAAVEKARPSARK